jgi:nucleoside-diphosphate-sugar epimerase
VQTILGAGGSVGRELARILPEFTDRVRLVSRNPTKVDPSNEVHAANLLDAEAVREAVAGSDVVYLLAGLPYRARIWEAQWPVIVRNVIEVCRAAGSRLVFFDNVYMYDPAFLDGMDEDTPVRPCSRKGEVRARIADAILSADAAGEIQGLIARSEEHSVLTGTVLERLAAGKAAQWLLSADFPHSFTYTPDAARGTAILGNADGVHGEVWHLPTAPAPPTGRQWVEAIARRLGVEPRLQVVGRPVLTLMGLFVPDLRELREMAYQYDRDYVFRSDRFERRFGFEPTGYTSGIEATIEADYG